MNTTITNSAPNDKVDDSIQRTKETNLQLKLVTRGPLGPLGSLGPLGPLGPRINFCRSRKFSVNLRPEKFPNGVLGTDVTSWALCFTHRFFNAGIQSTQQEQSNQNPTIGLPNIIGRYFKRIDSTIKKYLTPQILKIQNCQINESLLYRTRKIENWEVRKIYDFEENTNSITLDKQSGNNDNEQEQSYGSDKEQERFNNYNNQREQFDDSDGEEQSNNNDGEQERYDEKQNRLDNNNEDQNGDDENANIQENDEKIKFAENDNESKTLNLRSLITYINQTTIHEVWSVKTIEENKEHFAMFHIDLIPFRWYNDVTFDPRKELAITICSEKTRSNDDKNVYEHQVRTNFDLLNKIRHTHLFSETVRVNLSHKAKYNLGFGYAKQAIGLALELDCEDEINKILWN
ncbi:hypothetical protein Glove_34g33 [Diversispora epigaea]|uniref:Uncharacterized protein n=1 Tax=Diversispora epigaea TaxID=1348612 RepID=A0A397JRG2_9GLOM|nr:hypothetical protein Glove_34g33 [Diversispora epigaea]